MTTPMTAPTQPLDWGTITRGKIADATIGTCIQVLYRSRKAASRSERGWPGRCPVSCATSTASIVPDWPGQACGSAHTSAGPTLMKDVHRSGDHQDSDHQ